MIKYSSLKIWRLQLWKAHFEELVRIGDTASCWYFLNLSDGENFIQSFLHCCIGSIRCSVSGWLVFWVVYCLLEFPILIPDILEYSLHNTNQLEAGKMS